MRDFTDWLEKGVRRSYGMQLARRLVLADGTQLSVQAGDGAYCEPRKTMPYFLYESFEIGFPSSVIPEISKFAENEDDLTETVYPYVPVDVVRSVINARGGVVGQWVDGAAVIEEGDGK